jgi:glutamine phosphoribosylpyrophosphate amidotransferase
LQGERNSYTMKIILNVISKELCADSLGYQTIESLIKAIGIPRETFMFRLV